MKTPTLTKSLRILNILFKYLTENSNTLDFIAVQGLPKLKPFLTTDDKDLLLQIILAVTHLARSKQEYYPNINQLSIVKSIPIFLTLRQDIKIATLKLLGNLLKHSAEFLDQLN